MWIRKEEMRLPHIKWQHGPRMPTGVALYKSKLRRACSDAPSASLRTSVDPLGQVVAGLERRRHLLRAHALVLGEVLGVLPLEELDAVLRVCLTTEVAVRRSLLVLGLAQRQGLRDGAWPAVELHLDH